MNIGHAGTLGEGNVKAKLSIRPVDYFLDLVDELEDLYEESALEL
jgi:hypothetical protein